MKACFEIFQSAHNDQWYWRLRSCNGQTMAQSEGYTRRRDAERSIRRLKATVKAMK